MIRWVVIFEDSAEMLVVRARKDLRDAHVAYAKAHPELLIGGGLKPDTDQPFCGALWVVEAETRGEVERLVENDPFFFPEHRTFEIFTWGKLLEDQTATLLSSVQKEPLDQPSTLPVSAADGNSAFELAQFSATTPS